MLFAGGRWRAQDARGSQAISAMASQFPMQRQRM
jgi:hypothetical protein